MSINKNYQPISDTAELRRPDIASGRRAQWSQLPGQQPGNSGVRRLAQGLLIAASILVLIMMIWIVLGPPAFINLATISAVVLLLISALGISNNHQDRRPPGR